MSATLSWSTRTRQRIGILPGFGLSLGITLTYLSTIVLIPVAALFIHASGLGWSGLVEKLSGARVAGAFKVTFGISFIAALVNLVFGTLTAWVLVRYRFPGKRFFDAMVDLPFAMPTAVAGIALTALFAPNGWIGSWLEPLGLTVNYTQLGLGIALTFIGLPFMVRTLQPVIEELSREAEEAAACLGATRAQTVRRVIFPELLPAILTGFALAFARAVGEYGSVVFISGNIPRYTEVIPQLIIIRLEQYDYQGATALGAAMLVVSFSLLLIINLLQRWAERRAGSAA